MSGKKSPGRGRQLLNYLLHLFSGNAGLAFFGMNVRPEDAEEQRERERERERVARGESRP